MKGALLQDLLRHVTTKPSARHTNLPQPSPAIHNFVQLSQRHTTLPTTPQVALERIEHERATHTLTVRTKHIRHSSVPWLQRREIATEIRHIPETLSHTVLKYNFICLLVEIPIRAAADQLHLRCVKIGVPLGKAAGSHPCRTAQRDKSCDGACPQHSTTLHSA